MLVDPNEGTNGTGIALTEDDSLSVSFNEQTDDFRASSITRVQHDATVEDPQIDMDVAEATDQSALELLGIAVEDADGNLEYTRGAEREFDALELWAFESDQAVADAGQPDKVERYEDCRVDIGGKDMDGPRFMFDITIFIEGKYYFDWEEPV